MAAENCELSSSSRVTVQDVTASGMSCSFLSCSNQSMSLSRAEARWNIRRKYLLPPSAFDLEVARALASPSRVNKADVSDMAIGLSERLAYWS